jgi:SAM-dependent methyltransferase
MQSHPCPKCRTESSLAYSAADYNKKMSDVVFDYYRCPRDGIIFVDPVPDNLGHYYPEDYYAVPTTQEELARQAEDLQWWKLDTLLSVKKSGRMLEIGPAYGLFAFLAKRAGFAVTGIEMDARCCDFLRNMVGIDVVETSDTLGALEGLGQFDAIVMWQVIEHLPDPWSTLEAAAKHLAPGGVLILDTPNPAAFQFKVLGHRWAHLDAPRHVILIPEKVMTEHVGKHGLAPEVLTASNVSANGFNGFGWGFTFSNFVGDNPLGRFVNFAGRALAKVLIPIERTGWRGSTYTAIYRKQG